ncbi:hypothetical protein BDW62DRAFT_175465 [Aspergillus aurantiobrunneus]
MLIGSEIVRSVRMAVWNTLSYTCSAGIAKNKMMAKLGSATNKPNKQTIVRNRAIQNFLGGFKFTKIRMLGGKLGDQVTAMFGTEQVSDLLGVSLEQFRAKLNDDTAAWLYGIIRGDDRSEVNPRTQIKSMLSAKSFRPSINNLDQADKWLRIFAADIYGRLVEEGVLEHKRRPKTVALHHRQGAQVKSRQLPIPGSATIDEDLLFDLGKTLLRQVAADGSAWPCANLSLSVGGFEDGVSKNQAIDSFLLRGDQAKSTVLSSRIHTMDELPTEQQPTEKRRKFEDSGLGRFFNVAPETNTTHHPLERDQPENISEAKVDHILFCDDVSHGEHTEQMLLSVFNCPRCGKVIEINEEGEHNDWHYAKDLETQERQAARNSQASQLPNRAATPNLRSKSSRGGRSKSEKGQTRLTFG